MGKKSWIKSFLPKTLLGRSLVIIITPIFLIQVISTFMFFDRHWNKMAIRLSYAVAGELVMIATLIERNPDPEYIQSLTDLAGDRLGLIISYEPGGVLDKTPDTQEPSRWAKYMSRTFTNELVQQTSRPFTVDVDFEEKWVEVRLQLDQGLLKASLPQRRLFTSTTYIFLLWVYGSSAILLLISVLFMRNQIRPIRKLAIAAERFGKGRHVENFKVEGAREVRQAGQAFLDMRTRIQRQIQQRTAMLAGVSHDLRTPLTRMKLQLALLGDSPDIEALKGDIDEMEKMIEGYLNFVRGEGNETPVSAKLLPLIDSVIVAGKRHGNNIHLQAKELEDLTVTLRPLAMKRCLTNLISNASKYSHEVWVTVEQDEPSTVSITIEDNGPGIPEDQYEEVFKPFFRVDMSRNTETGGVGLGLPIAQDIVHAHGGMIALDRSGYGGLAVKIKLPV
ncbi:MAG: HAMP domain-containing protein [Alphaproteobacteria bacterium]|nr:HAMP domain-containing protein [Alphaproteobacteria bacterium]